MSAKQWVKVWGAIALAAAAVQLSPFRLGLVCGGSMAPTLKSGQPFLLDRSAYRKHAVSKDDILIFERDGTSYVKRVAAVAGESFFVLRYLDAGWDYPVEPAEVPRIRRMLRRSLGIPARVVRRQIPPGYCYVLGDAAVCSEDSRAFGPIPLEAVRGKLLQRPTTAPDAVRIAATHEPLRL